MVGRTIHSNVNSFRSQGTTHGFNHLANEIIRFLGSSQQHVRRITEMREFRPAEHLSKMAESLDARHDFDATVEEVRDE